MPPRRTGNRPGGPCPAHRRSFEQCYPNPAQGLAPLLDAAGFTDIVVDVDRVSVSYLSLDRLIGDLRAMAATNILLRRPAFVGRAARVAAARAFTQAGNGERTVETFEVLHFAARSSAKD